MDTHALPLEPNPRSVQAARRWVVDVCARLGRPDLADSAALGVSELVTRLNGRLGLMSSIFRPSDPLLASPSAALVAYLLVRSRVSADGDDLGAARTRGFFEWFQRARLAALERPEGEGDGEYVEYSELSQHGTNEARNIARRMQIVAGAFERYDANGTDGERAAPESARG